jgi:hypothetical protein
MGANAEIVQGNNPRWPGLGLRRTVHVAAEDEGGTEPIHQLAQNRCPHLRSVSRPIRPPGGFHLGRAFVHKEDIDGTDRSQSLQVFSAVIGRVPCLGGREGPMRPGALERLWAEGAAQSGNAQTAEGLGAHPVQVLKPRQQIPPPSICARALNGSNIRLG